MNDDLDYLVQRIKSPSASDSTPLHVLQDLERDLEELRAARKGSGTGFESVRSSASGTRTPAEVELLRRAALMDVFDVAQFNALLVQDWPSTLTPVPTFDAFVSLPEVELVDNFRNKPRYRVRTTDCRKYRDSWIETTSPSGEVSPARRQFGERLLAHYESLGPVADFNALGELIVVDRTRARERFLSLYDQADRNFDLARCYGLIGVLSSKAPYLGAELTADLGDRHRYYQARQLFIEEYYQTATYLQREGLAKHLEKLPDPADRWILHLHAPGGMGKTMFLRWLVARHAVMTPQRWPCARVDFDFVSLQAVANHPWLLLLSLARQLNVQIPNTPFYELTKEADEFAVVFQPGRSRRGPVPPEAETLLQVRSQRLAVEIPEMFARALEESPREGPPILLILDTLEEMVLARKEVLLKLLDLLDQAHTACPRVRLLLAGRMAVEDLPTEYRDRYGKVTQPVTLEPFTFTEAEVYLKEKRRLKSDHPIKAIWQQSGGHPFKLSLFAEMANSRKSLTAEEVAKITDPELAYLIDRVIRRIEERDLRWVVRYGVVPRRLTLDFLKDVMDRPLRLALAGNSTSDPLDDRETESASEESGPPWSTDVLNSPDDPLDLEGLFTRLRDYAASRGWISFDGGDAAQFQPDVINPLRALLRNKPVFHELHQAALQHYERLAEDEPLMWARHTCEAIYHRFQLALPGAEDYWRSKLKAPQAISDISVRHLLAEEVLRRDYAIGQIEPVLIDNRPIIDRNALLEAHAAAAEALVLLAATVGPKSLWTTAADHLQVSQAAFGVQADAVLKRGTVVAIQAYKLLDKGLLDEARAVLETARTTAADADLIPLEVLLGDIAARLKDGTAIERYQKALDLAQGGVVPGIRRRQLLRMLALACAEEGRYLEAERAYAEALQEAVAEADHATVADLHIQTAELHLRIDRLEQAALELDAVDPKSEADRFWTQRGRAELAMRSLDPLLALHLLTEVKPPSGDFEAGAAAAELQGCILAMLMDYGGARSFWDNAESQWRSAGILGGAERCQRRQIELVMRDVGDLVEARALLDRTSKSVDGPLDQRLRHTLLRIECHSRQGEMGPAHELWNETLALAWVRNSPRRTVMALATGIAYGLTRDFNRIQELIQALTAIHPEEARISLLREHLLTAPDLTEPFPDSVALLHFSPPPSSSAREYLPNARSGAELFRLSQLVLQSEILLREALAMCQEQSRHFAGWLVLEARSRLPAHKDDVAQDGALVERLVSNFARYPQLLYAVRTVAAERFLAADQEDIADRHLTATAELMPRSAPTRWDTRFMLAMAELSERKGRPTEAQSWRGQAAEVNARLGHRRQDQDLEYFGPGKIVSGRHDNPNFSGIESDPVAALKLRTVRDNGPSLRITLYLPHRPSEVRKVDAQGEVSLGDSLFPPPGEPVGILAQRLVSRRKILMRLRGLLLHWVIRPDVGDDLQLQVEPGPLTALPWELVLHEGGSNVRLFREKSGRFGAEAVVRWVQMALTHAFADDLAITGRWDEATAEAYREFQSLNEQTPDGVATSRGREKLRQFAAQIWMKRTGQRPLIALTLEPSDQRLLQAERGRGMEPARFLYRHAGFQVVSLENPSFFDVQARLRDAPPHVLHLTGTLSETSDGKIYLDFARGESPSQSKVQSQEGLSAPQLAGMLKSMTHAPRRPLIVLDILRPPGRPSEAVRQLFLRNLFAAELFDLGATWGIIGTGLIADPSEQDLYQPLLSLLARGETLGKAVFEARQRLNPGERLQQSGRIEDALTGAIALFTVDPSLSLIP